jgi:ABC-type multidrug transport system fused ATPase/permease subunit
MGRIHGIPRISGFFKYYSITWGYIGYALYLLIGLNLVAACVESIGILLFIPFLSQLSTGANSSPDSITTALNAFFSFLGLKVSIEHTLIALVIVFTFKGFLILCLNAFRPIFLNGIKHKMRENLIILYAAVDYRYSMSKSSGFFGNVLVSETDRACFAMEWYCRALTSLITAGVLSIITLVCYRLLSLLMIAIGVFSFFLLQQFAVPAKSLSSQLSNLNSRLNEFLVQALQSFKYLKVTNRFSTFQTQLLKGSANSRRAGNKLAVLNASHMALQEPLLVMCLASLAYYTVVVAGKSLPSVMVAGLFFYRCMIEMGQFNYHWQVFSSNVGSLDMVSKTQEDLRRHQEEQSPGDRFVFQESIEVRDLTYAYDSTPILHKMDLHIAKNSTVAIVGVSGAGKTTLIDLVAGLLKATNGGVFIDGRDLRSLDISQYRQSIGYVGQETFIFDTTIANNISMHWDQSPDSATFTRIQQAASDSYCDEFIGGLPKGFQTIVGERGLKLSGGQRQRLAIARELFRTPEILVLDEATSSLDSQSESYIRQSIERFKGKLTLIIISHRLSTIINADVIYVLEHGHVTQRGTFAELSALEGTAFRRMCELQHVV